MAQQEQYTEALTCYRSAYELDTSAIGYCTVIGELFNRLGRYEEALSYFDKALTSPSTETSQTLKGKHQALFGPWQPSYTQPTV